MAWKEGLQGRTPPPHNHARGGGEAGPVWARRQDRPCGPTRWQRVLGVMCCTHVARPAGHGLLASPHVLCKP